MPALWQKTCMRVFGIEPCFDGVTVEGHPVLPQRQSPASRHIELPGDKIKIRDRLRHRMLDLDARVHLEEIEIAAIAIE